MGRKSNPNILRISAISRTWEPKWFAARKVDYRDQLTQDLKIRQYFTKELKGASISRLEIARDQKEIVLTVHTSRPAVVIGRGGSGVEKIQKDISNLLRGKMRVRINVQEVSNPDTDAAAVATQIVDQLERRMPFRRVLKQSVFRAKQAGAVGVRVSLAGRLNGAEIARTEWLAEGNVPLHTFRADISYAQRVANTTYGTIGVKVWVNRGEISTEEKPAVAAKKQTKRKRSAGRRTSLAKAAASSRKAPKKKS